ncbi:anaphase-promoting complex subunit 5 [Danaus plexippus]|uniref:Anaphase-promoting complex subunit 5 n=1 Tax=Danaus plexippus plexippus TaxID=278856 RepID=A0A212ETZ8_DANPL|nr:anaphase-promoting complex subunit 5 [Danaus plexippus]OWR44924.1 putative anaphase-promoting complex subunit-5 [Danaus plexippus plexippus]
MDVGNDNIDFVKLINIKGNVDNITPHKIAVVAFIREYGLLKMEAKDMIDFTMAPKYRKDFCILALKLIQCPDMEFKELEALLTDGRYNLLSVHLQNFCVRLQNIYVNGINALMDCVTSAVDKLMIEQSETNPCIITRCSVLGFYLRRILLYLDKLTFVQVASLYKSFCIYYQKGRPGLMMRSLSKEKLNNMESQPETSKPSLLPEESKPQEIFMKMNIIDRDSTFEECQWSRKQAELFTAQQANLLQINEKKAMAPKQLQKTIMQIINDLPEYPDIHFLSFLNCIRMKEFCGAQDSLYNCFDRAVFNMCGSGSSLNDRNKNFRYAALNRAAMHTQFGHKSVAMEGVREALGCAQEAADSGCVAAAAAWGALAGGRARRAALLARVPRPPRAAAAAVQLMAQHAAVNAARPAEVFQIISKGDTINYLHSMTDLTMAGLANTAALWGLYGKTEMASVNCQLLLNLNTKCTVGSGSVWQWSEGSGAGAVCAAAWRGAGPLAAALASLFTSPAARAAAARHHATYALRAGKWEEADQSIRQLASYDRWESQLLRAEMYFLKENPTDALETLHDILDFCKTEDDSLHYMSLRLKAMIMMAEVQHTFSNNRSTNIMLLNEALSLARKYHLHFLAATAEMHTANVQLHMGSTKNALLLARKVLPLIMEHGSAYDMARGMLLYTKCRIATSPPTGEARNQVLQSCCEALDTVKENFSKVGAEARLLHTWYLQAQLYNDIGNIVARNQCAWMYRQLETQNPVEPLNMLHIMY